MLPIPVFSDPVVVAKPLSYNGPQPAVVRMQNVTPSSFEIRIQEWDYSADPIHVFEEVSWLAVERGHWTLPDGSQIEAGTITTDSCGTGSFAPVSFLHPFNTVPVVISSVMTYNDTDTVVTRNQNITRCGFEVTMQEQQLNTQSHAAETISYVAWEPGSGTLTVWVGNGFPSPLSLDYEVGVQPGFTNNWSPVSYGPFGGASQSLLADMQTTEGVDPCNLRYRNKTKSSVEVKVDEEQSADDEKDHWAEDVGYIVISHMEPWVTTEAATNIFETSAWLHGYLHDLNGADTVDVYFEFLTTDLPGIHQTPAKSMDAPGPFRYVEDLRWNQLYCYRAVATGRGTGYGEEVCFQTPTPGSDGDGVPNDVENGAPNGGDGNNDGFADSSQPSVASFPNAATGEYVTIEVLTEGPTLSGCSAIPEEQLPPDSDKPDYLDFPYGFFRFNILNIDPPGSDVDVKIWLPTPADPLRTEYWKWGCTRDNETNHWYRIENMTIGDGGYSMTVTLTDGGLGDDTRMASADGTIRDDGGPGQPPPGPAPIPTPSPPPDGEGGCFIATAAYGSYLDSHVKTLREFRDDYLLTNPVGSALVSAYYEVSPPIAEFIEDHPALKPIVRVGLLPAVAMSTVAVSTTSAQKTAVVGSLALVSALVVVWMRRRAVGGKL